MALLVTALQEQRKGTSILQGTFLICQLTILKHIIHVVRENYMHVSFRCFPSKFPGQVKLGFQGTTSLDALTCPSIKILIHFRTEKKK